MSGMTSLPEQTDTQGAHFFIAGDLSDLPLIRRMLERIPVDAYGQVYIEVAAAFQIVPLAAPTGITVTWLVADSSPLRHRAGDLTSRAVMAWVAEWTPEDPQAHEIPYVMWIGGSTTTVIDRLYERYGDALSDLHLHHR